MRSIYSTTRNPEQSGTETIITQWIQKPIEDMVRSENTADFRYNGVPLKYECKNCSIPSCHDCVSVDNITMGSIYRSNSIQVPEKKGQKVSR